MSNHQMNRRAVAVGIIGLIAIGLTGCAATGDQLSTAQNGSAASASDPAAASSGAEAVVVTPSYMVYGDPNASNTIDIYSDYLCPHCATFAFDVLPELKADVESGSDVKIVLHDFRVIDKLASGQMALVARAAGEQGKFDEMHSLLFTEQATLHEHLKNDTLTVDVMMELGEKAQVPDLEKFRSDLLDNDALVDAIIQDGKDGAALGVSGTPTVFVNGEVLGSPQLNVIREALNG